VPMWTTLDGGGSAIFQAFYFCVWGVRIVVRHTPTPQPLPPRPRAFQTIRTSVDGKGGCLCPNIQKSVFPRTSLMDDPLLDYTVAHKKQSATSTFKKIS